MSGDLIAISGFVALFAMMILRVPIGIAMGLVGVGGFAAVTGWKPALNLLGAVADPHGHRLQPDAHPVLRPDGRARHEFRHVARAVPDRPALVRLHEGRHGDFDQSGACAGFAAICGSSVATAATMTKIALPEMKQAGYPDEVSTGVIAAGGTLGILIPPSVVLAVYGYITEQDVGVLFIAGIVPGLLAILMYMARRAARLRPPDCPLASRFAWARRCARCRASGR